MAARILNYIYVGMELAVVAVFQPEIVPAPVSGMIVGTYQLSLTLGGLIINSVCRGTSNINDNRAWRIPLALSYVVPSIIVALIWFVPESPRWLVLNHPEEARANVTQLRFGAFNEEQIDNQFKQLQYALAVEQERGSFQELFQGVNLKRTMIVVTINFFQQATGQAFASQYGTVYIKSLGTVDRLNMTLVLSAINVVTLVVSLVVNDRIGKRLHLMWGAVIQAGALLTMGGLGTAQPVMTFDKIGIVSMIAVMAVGFLVNFSIPYLISDTYAGLKSKAGFIFGAIAVLAVVFTWCFVPECKGKTLEQIDMMFHEGIRLRDFDKYNARSVAMGEGEGEIEDMEGGYSTVSTEDKFQSAVQVERS